MSAGDGEGAFEGFGEQGLKSVGVPCLGPYHF